MAHKSHESDTGRFQFKRGPKPHAGRDAVAAPGTCATGRLADSASEAADCIVVFVVPGSQLDGGRDDLWTRIRCHFSVCHRMGPQTRCRGWSSTTQPTSGPMNVRAGTEQQPSSFGTIRYSDRVGAHTRVSLTTSIQMRKGVAASWHGAKSSTRRVWSSACDRNIRQRQAGQSGRSVVRQT
jgi:hypothetical protein